MKRLILNGLMIIGSVILSGCGVMLVSETPHASRSYCADCHRWPTGHTIYSRCNYFEIRAGVNGYYYRPLAHDRYVDFKYKKYANAYREDNLRKEEPITDKGTRGRR
jgi:hypothetical protein